VILMRREDEHERFLVVVRLAGEGPVNVETHSSGTSPRIVLTTEDPRFAIDPHPPESRTEGERVDIRFQRPGAVILAT
jgi:hypothetical protein